MNQAIFDVPYIDDPVEVGSGGFATVYRAVDRQAGRPVAVKLLTHRPDESTLKSFDREREALARLSTHPNVVTLHRTGLTTGGVPYLVMEYAPGGSLAGRVKSGGPVPWAEAVELMIPVCAAVEHAHAEGFRHRDVKPQNILISAHDKPLLTDFGIAGLTARTETMTGNAKLSLSYASPEQIDGRDLADETDVYSLGATLYAVINGMPAFVDSPGPGFLNTAKRILEEPPPPLDESVPIAIRNAIAAAMAKDPAHRPSVADFRRGLAGEIELEGPPATDRLPDITREYPGLDATTTPPEQPVLAVAAPPPADRATAAADTTGPSPRRRAAVPAAVLALALVITTGAVVARSGPGDEPIRSGVLSATADAPAGPTVAEDQGSTSPGDGTDDGSDGAASATTPSGPAVDGGVDGVVDDEADGDGAEDGTGGSAAPSTSLLAATAPTTAPDGDDDGRPDDDDNCPDTVNPDQANADGDGLGDDCDPDDDNDGVDDTDDNCRLAPNPGQGDVDLDDLGDACDDFPDRDGDGIIDTADTCVEEPTDPDTDGDGTPDKCDDTPRGMVTVATSAEITRVTVENEAYGDGEVDMFGDLKVDGEKFDLPEIPDRREVRPGNWLSGRVDIEPGSPVIEVRVWIRDEDRCFLCKDGLIDLSPDTDDALRLLVDTATGQVDLADENWNRIGPAGSLTGSPDGNLTGTITQRGDDDGIHIASIDLALTLFREPAP